ncbi:MAG: NUDIX domain-containing protein [Burkholderiales bacterium]
MPDTLTETLIDGEWVLQGNFLQVRRERVQLPSGREAQREFVVHPGAVMVVPLLDSGELLLERQYRHPLGRVMLEFPAGKLDAGEDPLTCGQRELLEETGYSAREWAYAGLLNNAIAYSTEGIHIYFARGLQAGFQQLDEGEFLELVAMSPEALDSACASGEVTDAKTLIGLLWLQRWRAGVWPLEWRHVGR